jgi:predicted nucleic acid-binding protein
VLTENLNFFSKSIKPSRRQVLQSVRGILGSPSIIVVPQSRRSFLPACDLYEARADKGYSQTDSISMHTMERAGLKDILTNDRHFEQEGFMALFRT